jgi:hypothetical protein
MQKFYVQLNGKEYTVSIRDAYTTQDGDQVPEQISIWVQWQIPSVADRWSVRPMMIDKSASVSPYGVLGKKILKQLQLTAA